MDRSVPEVYPRECGAALFYGKEEQWAIGLSPRVRGSPVEALGPDLDYGSIPASAGQPLSAAGEPTTEEVYPRECGAATFQDVLRLIAEGLSPRVRGSLRSFAPTEERARSIPASAGQPISTRPARFRETVYPRECGAAMSLNRWWLRWSGLSPRVRGSL